MPKISHPMKPPPKGPASKLLKMPKRAPKSTTALWEGPDGQGDNGGVTQGLLARWLVCRERCRLWLVEGLHSREKWHHRMGYGNLWHLAEEERAKGKDGNWQAALLDHCKVLVRDPINRLQQEEIDHWYHVCKTQFPLYDAFWSKQPEVKGQPICQEFEFSVPHKLPSGRVVRLRGKWDSVHKVTEGAEEGVWLKENKSKGQVNEGQIRRQLSFDLQTCLYLVALRDCQNSLSAPMKRFMGPIRGVLYNVVRRPLSGGKGTIKRGEATKGSKCSKCKGVSGACPKCNGCGRIGMKPAETKEAFYARLGKYIADDPKDYFLRLLVEVTPEEIVRFERECLDPVLESLCDWWEWITTCSGAPYGLKMNHVHWRTPFGFWSPLLDSRGGETDLDAHIKEGSMVGLERAATIFPELNTAKENH